MSEQKATSPPSVAWHVSSYSANGSGQCVEIGQLAGDMARFAVRDSTQRGLGYLTFDSEEWAAFLHGVHSDEF